MNVIDPIYLDEVSALSREEALAEAKRQTWYHTIDLTPEFRTNGIFDLTRAINGYGFPDDLTGKSVLDIGRSSGFFAFEFEKRGANVVATELPSTTDKNYVGGDITSKLISDWLRRDQRSDPGRRVDFYLAHRVLESNVAPVDCSIEHVHTLGEFDLVFVGSLLNHVRDIGGALMSVRKATRDICIIANPVTEDTSDKPLLEFDWRLNRGLTTWFIPNVAALVNLVEAAGFVDVRVHNPALPLPFKKRTMSHAIIHARRGSAQEERALFAEILEAKYPGIAEMLG